MRIEEGPAHDSEDNPRAEIVAIIEVFHSLDNLRSIQAWILDGRELMPHVVTHLVRSDVLVLPEIVVEFSPWIGMGDRYLDRFTIELLSKLHSTLDGLRRFPRQP